MKHAFMSNTDLDKQMSSTSRNALSFNVAATETFGGFFERHPDYTDSINHYGDHLVTSLDAIGLKVRPGKFAKNRLFMRDERNTND